MTAVSSWRHLEQRVADYFQRSGYTARTNQKVLGRSGLHHEIDVLAEKRDAAGLHRVAVECKAWRSPIEKDIVYKFERVMQDTGLTKGVIVSAGGLRSGARIAAEQAHIEVWGPDEIRHRLGEEALAGLPLALPDEALGTEVSVNRDAAMREIKKGRTGFAGIGAEEVVSMDLVWVPAYELELAVTRLRPGVLRDREEVVRRWNLYDAVAGRLVGQRDDPRKFSSIALTGAVLRPQKAVPQVVAEMRRTITKHRNARTETAQKTRQAAYNALGLPGTTREFVVEADKHPYLPYYVGVLSRKGTERLIAVHGAMCTRSEAVEQALHERIDLFRRALNDTKTPPNQDGPSSPDSTVAPEPAPAATEVVSPTCRCGQAMVLRHRRADDAPFWGCPAYPLCRHTLPV